MINEDLNDLIWKEFYFEDIFDVNKGFYNKKPDFSNSGRIPFLGARVNNNGITGFCSLGKIEETSKTGHGKNHSLKDKIFEGNCIVVTNNGSSMGYAYYQKNEFTCSHDINPLYLKNHELNRYIALFLIVLIEKQKICFEYSRKWRPERMKKSKIIIPVTNECIPDWDFMESYIKTKEKILLKKYKSYIERKLLFKQDKEEYQFSEDFFAENIKWGEFVIENIFHVHRGKRLIKNDRKPGRIPYYSATCNNNGVTDFISNPLFVEENKILVTTFGDAFFAEGEFTASDEITILHNDELNKYNSLFVCAKIRDNNEKFKFGYKCFSSRIKRQTILLPLDENNDPDWDFMEAYMKQLEYKKISKYLDYIEDRIN
jgi:hypothetical protein